MIKGNLVKYVLNLVNTWFIRLYKKYFKS